MVVIVDSLKVLTVGFGVAASLCIQQPEYKKEITIDLRTVQSPFCRIAGAAGWDDLPERDYTISGGWYQPITSVATAEPGPGFIQISQYHSRTKWSPAYIAGTIEPAWHVSENTSLELIETES